MTNFIFGFVVNSFIRLAFTKRVYRILNIFDYPTMDMDANRAQLENAVMRLEEAGKKAKDMTNEIRCDIAVLKKEINRFLSKKNPRAELETVLMRLEEVDKKLKDMTNEMHCFRYDIAVLIKEVNRLLPKNNPRKAILLNSVPSSSNFDETPSKRLKTTAGNVFDSNGFRLVEDYVMVYTSGVCHNCESDKAKAGIGVWFGENYPKNISRPVVGEATKNKADIQACLIALGLLKDCGVRKVKLHTSSKLIMKCMTLGIGSPKAKNSKTDPSSDVENKDLVDLNKCAREFDDVQWVYLEDRNANKLAEKGAVMYINYKKPQTAAQHKVASWKDALSDKPIEVLDLTGPEDSGLKDASSIVRPKRKQQSDETDSEDAGFQKSGDYVVVYTDGACSNNGKPGAKAGIGVWFGDNHRMNISKPVEGKATNNAAEIQACIAALETLKACRVEKVELHTDSQFTLNSITVWIHRWKKGGWKTASGKGVKNKEDFMKLDECVQHFDDIRWVLEQGHAGVRGNEEADKLAKLGAARYKPKPI